MRLELALQSTPCWWARETVLPLIILSNRVRQDPEHDSWLWGHNFQGFRAPAASRPWEHTAPITPLHIRKCAYYDLHSATVELAVVPSMEKYQYLQERVFDLHPDNHPFFLRQNNIPILLGWEISPVNFSKENTWRWLANHPPAWSPSIFCILLFFYLDSPTVHVLSAPATQHVFLSSKILFHFARSAPWKMSICKSGSEAVTWRLMLCAYGRRERGLAAGGDVPGIHEAVHLAWECITA